MNRYAVIACAVVLGATTAWSQSLGEAAAREKKRREEVEKKKGAAKVVTDTELSKYSGGRPLDTGATGATGATPASGSASASPAPASPSGSPAPPSGSPAPPSESRDDGKKAIVAGLRQEMASCQASVKVAEQRVADAEAHRSFVNSHTNSNTYALQEAENRLKNAQANVDTARRACDAIIDRARTQGIAAGALW